MPDVTVLPTGGTQSRGGTNWLLIGGIGVAAVFLLLMMTRKSSGQPTTAAGTSINAALGSIQEQNLNVMGEVSKAESNLSNELGAVNNNVIVGPLAASYMTNQVAWAASEQTTNPADAQARLTNALQTWFNMGGNQNQTPPSGFQMFPPLTM